MLRWRALTIILALSPAGCQRACSSRIPLAQLVSQRGDVTAETDNGEKSWHGVEVGFAFFQGDALRTGVGSKATVGLGVRGSLKIESESIIRFGAKGGGKSAGVSVEEGEAILEGATGDLYFQTDIGVALLEAGTQARMSRKDGAVRVDVLVGAAVFEQTGREAMRIERGEGIAIEVGSAVLEKTLGHESPISPADDADDGGIAQAEALDEADAGDAEAHDTDAQDVADASAHLDGHGAAGEDAPRVAGTDAENHGPFKLDVRGSGASLLRPGAAAREGVSRASFHAEPGTKLRLKRSTSAVIRRGDAEAKLSGPAEVVLGDATGPLLFASTGRVTYAADAAADVSVQVPGGLAMARAPRSRAELAVSRQGSTVVTAAAGQVILDVRGERTTLAFGESATLTRQGGIRFTTKNPEIADFTIRAGESVTVHDALTPTAIGFDFSTICPQEGRVELAPIRGSFRRAHGRASGNGRAILSVQPGRHRYRITCSAPAPTPAPASASAPASATSPSETDARASTGTTVQGTLRVVRDAGRTRLPSSSASNTVEADGRRYTILYQSLLPRLVFSWRRAPLGRSFVLTLAPTRGPAKTYASSTPSFTFASGQVPEGEYRFWWAQTDGAQRRSPETVLKLDFDNAAPSMSLRSPPVRVPPDASTVHVEGAAVPGATVAISGQPVELDRHLRFRAEAHPNPGETAVAIRIEHPRRGVHYYLRKVPGATRRPRESAGAPPP